MLNRRHLMLGLGLASALGLAACSGPYNMGADVRSFGVWPEGRAPGSYAIERLPSQRQDERHLELEKLAAGALEKAGFKPAADAKSADMLVTLGARVSLQDRAPWDDPMLWWRWHGGVNAWRFGPGLRHHYPFGWDEPRYDREVALLLRDRQSNEPLYEARASSDGLSSGSPQVFEALFGAALSDFPKAEPKVHRVVVQVMR